MPSFQENLNEPTVPPSVAPVRAFTPPNSGGSDAAVVQGIANIGGVLNSAFKQYSSSQDTAASNEALKGITNLTKARQQNKITAMQHNIKLGELQRDLNKQYPARVGIIEGTFKASLGAAAPNLAVSAASAAAVQRKAQYEATGRELLGEGMTTQEYVDYGRKVAARSSAVKIEQQEIANTLAKRELRSEDQFQLFRKAADLVTGGMLLGTSKLNELATTAISLGGNAEKDFQNVLAPLVNAATNEYLKQMRASPAYALLGEDARKESDAYIKQQVDLIRETFDSKSGALAIEARGKVLEHFTNVVQIEGAPALRLVKVMSSVLGDRVMGAMVQQGLLKKFKALDQFAGVVDEALGATAGITGNEKDNIKAKLNQYLHIINDPNGARKLQSEVQIKTTLDAAQQGALALEKVSATTEFSETELLSWANHTSAKAIIGLEFSQDAKNTAAVANSFTSNGFHTMLGKLHKTDPAMADAVADNVITSSMQAMWAAVQESREGSLTYDPDTGRVVANRTGDPDYKPSTSLGTPSRTVDDVKFTAAQAHAGILNKVLDNVLRLQKYDIGLSNLNGKQLKNYLVSTATAKTGVDIVAKGKKMDLGTGGGSDLVEETTRRSNLLSIKFQRNLEDTRRTLVSGIRRAGAVVDEVFNRGKEDDRPNQVETKPLIGDGTGAPNPGKVTTIRRFKANGS